MARRPRTWITDMTHYLDEGMLADMPTPAMDLALHLGAIVAWVSSHAASPLPETNVRCRVRTRAYGRCVGDIQARIAPDDAIEWFCFLCHESGRISGWRQTPWDRSRGIAGSRTAGPSEGGLGAGSRRARRRAPSRSAT